MPRPAAPAPALVTSIVLDANDGATRRRLIESDLPAWAFRAGWRQADLGRLVRLDGTGDGPFTAELRDTTVGWIGALCRPPRMLRGTYLSLDRALEAFYAAEGQGPLSTLWAEGTGIPVRPGWHHSASTSLLHDSFGIGMAGRSRWVATANGYQVALEVVQRPVAGDGALFYVAFVDTVPLKTPRSEAAFDLFDDPCRAMLAAEVALQRQLGPVSLVLDEVPNVDRAINARADRLGR
jgi:hypothetical protein